jgi:hypothetical protein
MLLNFIIYIVSSACNNVVSFNVFGAYESQDTCYVIDDVCWWITLT